MRFGILGPLQVESDMGPVAVRTPRQRALLAVLLVHANQVVSAHRLIELLWNGRPPADAIRALHVHLSQLRQALHPHQPRRSRDQLLSRRPPGYVLAVAPGALDLHIFEGLVEQARRARANGDLEQTAARLGRALALWRGPALTGVEVAALQESVAPRLEEARLVALEERIEAELLLGRHRQLVGELQGLVAEHPMRERLWGQLMLALYRAGRQGEALAAYTQARRRLVEELGLEPGAELRTLQRQILAGDPELDAPASPAARTPTRMAAIPAPCQLPPGLADFTGRLEALRDARRWVEASEPVAPTVTVVTGKAGVGKTAVAVQLAHQLRPRFPDGQLFVNLRGAGTGALDPAEALTGLLGGLGIDRGNVPQDFDDRVNLYRSLLADRRVLVLLDNGADERQLRPLLPSGVGCAALVTSRARLAGLEGAHTLVLDVFRTDEALELLARIAGPQRVAAEQEAARAVVEYCGRLPLAVRIAAARLVTRPERRLWTLARVLSDERRRLDELRAGDLEVRASIALSYQSQDGDVRRALRLLGLAGADTFPVWLPAALLGLDPEDDTLAERLLDAGLLEAAGLDAAGQERYQFHDLVRVFARERLADQESAESRQAAVERAARAYLARAQGATRDWFAAERASLVATVQQAHAGGLWELTWRLALAASRFFEAYSHWDDWSGTHELALDAASRAGDQHARAMVLRRLGDLYLDQSNWSQALAHYSACLPVFRRLGDRHGEAHVLCGLGDTHREQGRLPEALDCFTACLPIFCEVGDLRGEAETLRSLGIVFRQQGKLDDALAHLEECVRISAGLDDPRWQAIALRSLGMVHRDQERLDEARACFERSLAALRAFGDRLWQAYTLNSLGQVLCEQGAFAQAEAALAESVSIFEQLHDRCGEAYALQALGDALGGQRRLDEARAVLDRSLATFRQLQHRPGEAWALQSLGDTLNAQGHPDQARELLEQALRMSRELSLHPCEARARASLDAIAAPAR